MKFYGYGLNGTYFPLDRLETVSIYNINCFGGGNPVGRRKVKVLYIHRKKGDTRP